ncbi:AAA family ATPase [Methylocella sp.]|uniref:bifunctional aminoglycoside phosphotransferase/ATP-binding protein n=1 Tax=Methylocella sp. TaxID=1978226 RepID=UPI00378483AB
MDQHQADDQSAAFAFLADPATHGLGAGAPVARVSTHGAELFLAGPDVYKVKRAVRFPFMDFSTLEKRRAACEAEIAVNRPNAPQLYVEALPITRRNGGLALGGEGEIVEWAARLRRFDAEATFDRLAARGALDETLARKLGATIAAAHRKAAQRRDSEAAARLEGVIEDTTQAIADAPERFDAATTTKLARRMRTAHAALRSLLERREAHGFVRRCHGDLHLRNIVLLDGEPTLFDALEFDERLATCDVLYDLAFALMDLWTRGLEAQANAVMNSYLATAGEMEAALEGLEALPLFLSLRAAIRARVALLEPELTPDKIAAARRLFEQACAFLDERPPALVAAGGRSGTGKTRFSQALAPRLGRAPGAVHLRSDVERKRLNGVGELDRLPPDAYRPELSAPVYRRLEALAAVALGAGQAVVLDAAFLKPAERAGAERTATDAGTRFCGLWLDAPLALRLERVAARRSDASDAGVEVARAQEDYETGVMSWTRLDAAAPLTAMTKAALEALDAKG